LQKIKKKYKYWTKELCISVAKSCNCRNDFKRRFSGAWYNELKLLYDEKNKK
jgi:hypothetical protein